MEDKLLYLSLSFLLLLVAYFKLFLHATRHKHLPPSSPSLPLLGHLHLLKKPLHRTFHRLSQTYGQVYSFRFGSRLVVIVSSLSAVEECFTKNDMVLANRPRFLLGKHIGYNYTTMSSSSYGDHWRNLRHICTLEIFSTNWLNMFSGVRKDEVKHLLRKLSKLNNNSGGFAKVEFKSMFLELTFNIITRMVAGKRYNRGGEGVKDEKEAKQFREIIKEILGSGGASNPGEFVPILRCIDYGGLEKRMMRLAARTDVSLQGLIDEVISKDKDGNNMISYLLSLQKSEPEYYTDQIIKGLIQVLIVAGTDTSAMSLEWAMSNMINHLHVLKKAKVELDNQIGQEKLIDEIDVSKLHYIQSIILETLRLYPVAPLLVPHLSSNDCTMEGYDIPRDTILLVNAWTIQRDPKLWNDATSFKPKRFGTSKSNLYKLMPFGLGRRACPGPGLAQCTLGLTLGSMIQCFEWERVTIEEVYMAESNGVTMPKVIPLEAMCKALPIVHKVLSKWQHFVHY